MKRDSPLDLPNPLAGLQNPLPVPPTGYPVPHASPTMSPLPARAFVNPNFFPGPGSPMLQNATMAGRPGSPMLQNATMAGRPGSPMLPNAKPTHVAPPSVAAGFLQPGQQAHPSEQAAAEGRSAPPARPTPSPE